MKKGIYLLPNGITLCGMFAGFYSIMLSIKGDYVTAAWAIIIAMVFDGLDGWTARLTHATSKFGIELDSLSDVIAFGVAPAALVYNWSLIYFAKVGFAASFLFMACGALRLARFNVQMGREEKKHFTGMPIPGAAFVISSMVIFYKQMEMEPDRSFFILMLVISLAVIMVSTMKFHSLKEIDFSKRKPFWILALFVITFAAALMHLDMAMFVFSVIYLVWGITENVVVFAFRKGKALDTRGGGGV